MSYLAIFLGAGLGGVLRFLIGSNIQRLVVDWGFPFGTFCVNLTGCLMIGIIAQLAESRVALQGDMRLFLVVGVLGGYTTFSSFGYETFQLIKDGEYLYAALNASLQVFLGLGAVWLGTVLARLW